MSTETIIAEMRAEAGEFRKAANYPKTEYGIGAAGAACIIAEAIEGWADRLADEWETRADGERVRKDRWEVGFRNIVTALVGPRTEFEIPEIVERVRKLAKPGYVMEPDDIIDAAAQRQEQEGISHG